MPIDPTKEPYVLKGRVVTMGEAGVIDDGRVFIKDSMIVAVTDAAAPPPEGFEGAEEIAAGDTIYPGMIELHNHLSYNAIPLWDVPKRYAHNGSWRGKPESKRAVNKPAQVLANTDGMVEAIVRFVECRCLLGGVTTSQGITLATAAGIVSFYDGLVRNVERPSRPDLPRAGTRIADPPKDPAAYLERLNKNSCYLQHLSEGFGSTPRERFTRLRFQNGEWAVNDALCGIHSTALTGDDFKVLAEHNGTMVWSPLSNLLLYGRTADIAAAKNAGVPIALGSDWAPSGSKNLLGELKVAKLISKEHGDIFTDEELAAMATITPARICKWDKLLGTVEAGKLADLVLLNGRSGNPYKKLVEARETTVSMVIIDGIPRVGQESLMSRFKGGTERIKVGSSKRVLDLTPRAGDDVLDNITLKEATDRLRDGLERLPELAEALDAAVASGFDGSVGSTGAWTDTNIAPRLRVMLEFEDDDASLSKNLALGAGDLSDWVDPMVMDEITVADDTEFLRKIVRQRNLPRYIVEGLPKLHGRSIAVPSSAGFLNGGKGFVPELLDTRELGDFLQTQSSLSLDERRVIVEQAVVLLQNYYVHLPMKRAKYGIDPVQRLRVLQHELEQKPEDAPLCSDLAFHQEMIDIFNSLRDLHTVYRLPRPYKGKIAWLPFMIEEATDGDRRKFLVTHVVGNAGPKTFKVGVEALFWNGTPMETLVRRLAREMPCGNPAARRARALNSLTQRLLTRGQIPDEHWVTLRYREKENGPLHDYEQPWLVFEPSFGCRSLSTLDTRPESLCIGLDDHVDELQDAKRALFASPYLMMERQDSPEVIKEAARADGTIPTGMPTVLRARTIKKNGREYGYLRIFTFHVDDADEFTSEVEGLLRKLGHTKGLIIDLRGNSGGLIHAAEKTLELLSPIPITPQPVQFVSTEANLDLCESQDGAGRIPGLDLTPWFHSISRSVVSGAHFSAAIPLTPEAECNRRGQVYQAPTALIVDGLCYSATDMFIAGFKDHGLGSIIGVDGNTGAGGANVWSHGLLRRLVPRASSKLRHLPRGADMRVAVRRVLRVGSRAAEIVEDFGIAPDVEHEMTEKDVLKGNVDLIDKAVGVLDEMPSYELTVDVEDENVLIRGKGVDCLELTIDGQRLGSRRIEKGKTTIGIGEVRDAAGKSGIDVAQGLLDVVGYRERRPVVRTRRRLKTI